MLTCGALGVGRDLQDWTGFLIMQQHPHTWRVQSHGCYKFDNADLGFGPRDQTAHFHVFFHLRVTYLPGPDSIMRSDHLSNVAWNGLLARTIASSNLATTQTQPFAAPSNTPPRTHHFVSTAHTGKHHVYPTTLQPIGSEHPGAQLKRPLIHHRDMLPHMEDFHAWSLVTGPPKRHHNFCVLPPHVHGPR